MNSNLNDVIIIGAGGCGREVANWIEDINRIKPQWNILGFLDDNLHALEHVISKYKIIGKISDHKINDSVYYVMGIANPIAKRDIGSAFLTNGARFASIIHPSTRIYTEYELGLGLITYPNSKIATGCKIGDFVTLQSTILGHDSQLDDFVTVSSSCGITGGVKVHEGSFIGDHACISINTDIGKYSYIGIGSVVIRDVADATSVFGNPARPYPKKKS